VKVLSPAVGMKDGEDSGLRWVVWRELERSYESN
jgi:hypothetical protein